MIRVKKNIEINTLKKLTDKDIFIVTTVIYMAILFLYELYYCNFKFFMGEIQNYNFSLYRIIFYIAIYSIYYKFKKPFIQETIKNLDNKSKCYFMYLIIFLTILSIIAVILLSIINGYFNINIVVWLIAILNFNLFAIYISNNMIKNIIVMCLTFGTIFAISITFNNQLDEKIHFLSSYSVSLRSSKYEEGKE